MASLYLDRRGCEVRLSGDVLICYENDERIATIPLAPIDRLYIKGDMKLQASLLAKLGEQNIGVVFLSGRKNTPSLFLPQAHNDARRRFAQYQLMEHHLFCESISQKLICLKLQMQKKTLSQLISFKQEKKGMLENKIRELDVLIYRLSAHSIDLASLRGVEGRAAAIYFDALSQYLPESLGFDGRNRRPPKDPVNAMLSLGYTLLHSDAVLACYGAGLDPYLGFYHSLDFGRESLACDLIEPLRPLLDYWVIRCFQQRVVRIEHFSTTQEGCLLGKTGRVQFYQAFEKVANDWRKILEESSRQLVHLVQADEIQREKLFAQYYFSLFTLLENMNVENVIMDYSLADNNGE